MVRASFGEPKLIGVDLRNNSIFANIVFSADAAPPASYLNDVRFDLSSLLHQGKESRTSLIPLWEDGMRS